MAATCTHTGDWCYVTASTACPVEGAFCVQEVDWEKVTTSDVGGFSDSLLQFPLGVAVRAAKDDVMMLSMIAL